MYLEKILQKYAAKNLAYHNQELLLLKGRLKEWAGNCFVNILDSGSRAKGTAISLASDVDYLVSLSSSCNANNGGLKAIFESLHTMLRGYYPSVRRQNVSVRINLNDLEVDVTPARLQPGYLNFHSIHLSKMDTWRQTNIQQHISDISKSGRLNEIKLTKIWRELNGLDFSSIYLEYLITDIILYNKPKSISSLETNFQHILSELARDVGNPIYARIVDSANSGNILSDLLTVSEKERIKTHAKIAAAATYWQSVVS